MPFRLIFVYVLLLCADVSAQQKQRILIAAASDLKFALDSIISVYRQGKSIQTIEVSYGSSGKMYEQISNGAPFDMFFSADKEYPQRLKNSGHAASDVMRYGVGRLVLWTRLQIPLQDPMNLLTDGKVKKVAIANPVHAPYGRSAEQSLRYYQLYDKIQDKLVFGENISQTAQFVTSGAADVGIIALSLAVSPVMKRMGGTYYVIPSISHKPLEQAYIILDKAKNNNEVTSFEQFIRSDGAKKIFSYFGFSDK